MIRRVFVGEFAISEAEEFRAALSARSGEKAELFEEEFAQATALLQEFPFAKAVCSQWEDLEIRRVTIGRGPYVLFYFVYPSVDFQTGEALDVIYILACRHERQGELNWEARDPFRL